MTTVKFGADLTNEISALLKNKNTFVLTDDNVFTLYAHMFTDLNPTNFVAVKHGEDSKTYDGAKTVLQAMLKAGLDRKGRLVAVGGGVTGDLGGFCASVYKRGVEFVSVPTTLLSQVDSGIGGKTGVNFDGIKNVIGSFHFPSVTYISSEFLKTLPKRELICGLGEILKTALLDKRIFDFYIKNEAKILALDLDIIQKIVVMCAEFKQKVVKKDPYEKTGLRKILNLGHTLGHAFEKADGAKKSHGEYVLYGILCENNLCSDFIPLSWREKTDGLVKRALNLAGGLGLNGLDKSEVISAALSDKKNDGEKISVIASVADGKTNEVFFSKEDLTNKLCL